MKIFFKFLSSLYACKNCLTRTNKVYTGGIIACCSKCAKNVKL